MSCLYFNYSSLPALTYLIDFQKLKKKIPMNKLIVLVVRKKKNKN